MSEYTSPLKAAICEFKKKGIVIKKESDNPFFKSKYADLATILDAIEIEAAKCGLVITSQLITGEQILLLTSLSHKDSAEEIISRFPVFGSKPQEIGSSISYARRYNIQSLLNLAAEDDDGNAANEAPKVTAKAVYGTNAAMVAKYKEIQAAMETCETHEELAAVWKESSPHVLAMKKMDETFHDQLVAFKDKQKKSISDLLAVKASFPEQFMEAK